ncbi:MAG: Rho termination factor N-terminal domain-containing protein [Sedimentisphaerales bacterium]|nr:Rho termination factor N-terminal domain-containing protein [Sedimentisphaerales bacterium]
MVELNTKPKTMSLNQIRKKAQELGIDPGKMKKPQLIHEIQKAEGNQPCFGTTQGWCQYSDCCFMDDCLKSK